MASWEKGLTYVADGDITSDEIYGETGPLCVQPHEGRQRTR